jgi:gluconolactonase
VLTDRYEGKRYNSPNDVCVDPQGRIWFTDPYYGEDRGMLEMGAEAVYRIEPRRLGRPGAGPARDPEAQRDRDHARRRTLYVIDSHSDSGGNRKIWAFAVAEDGP